MATKSSNNDRIPTENKSATGVTCINTGNYLMDRGTINNIPKVGSVSLEREVLPSLIADGVSGYVATDRFIDIGTPKDLKFFTKKIRSGIAHPSRTRWWQVTRTHN